VLLSALGGRRQPLFLSATAEEDGVLVRRALRPDFLEVHVKPQAETLAKATVVQLTPHRRGSQASRDVSRRRRRYILV
jgi:hypothetical protein